MWKHGSLDGISIWSTSQMWWRHLHKLLGISSVYLSISVAWPLGEEDYDASRKTPLAERREGRILSWNVCGLISSGREGISLPASFLTMKYRSWLGWMRKRACVWDSWSSAIPILGDMVLPLSWTNVLEFPKPSPGASVRWVCLGKGL